jgi:Ca2+-binding EF-hand superfamily protein
MEKLMQEKTKVDKMDMALKRKPRAMFEFVSDFFLSHFGLQTLANRQLKAMSISLEELHRVGHPYGVFFCRILSLYHPRPVPADLAAFLMIVQSMFNKLVPFHSQMSFAQHYEVLQYGGNASIVDVMELVMKICKADRKVGERIIYSIHKDSEKKLEISLLKACGTLAKMNSDPKSVFELLDSNETQSLDYHEFVDGIRYTLGIWIGQEEAEDICAYLDKDSNGNVTMEEWVEKIDFDEFRRKIKEPAAFVTKVEVLNAFIEEYELEMIEEYNRLRQRIKKRTLSREDFSSFIKEIDPDHKDHEILKMFERLRKDENNNFVSSEGTCMSVLKNKVGGFGIGIFDLEKMIDLN